VNIFFALFAIFTIIVRFSVLLEIFLDFFIASFKFAQFLLEKSQKISCEHGHQQLIERSKIVNKEKCFQHNTDNNGNQTRSQPD